MNKRVLELAFKVFDEIDPGEPGTYIELNVEKFAELIIKEAGEYLMRPEFIGRSDLDWSMILNEHFGVK